MQEGQPTSVSAALEARIRQGIADQGGWISFERFMDWALYTPGLGYYASDREVFGLLPRSGSDFATAPQMSPLFGRTLAAQVVQGLDLCAADDVFEFGAGSGALAESMLEALGERVRRYHIVDVSGHWRERQRQRLAPWGDRVVWLDRLPAAMRGVVVGNEVLDAMPARLLAFDGLRWNERGVAVHEGRFAWADVPTTLRPPVPGPWPPGTVTEIHPQAQAFVATIADQLEQGLALFIDYGFPEAEYYHPQRSGGTLMCHRAHQADTDPLTEVGSKDITVHVDFTGIALAAQEAGLQVLGYTSQGRFLLNCGMAPLLEAVSIPQRSAAHRLLAEHEMGELFKVIALGRGIDPGPSGLLGFQVGDRTHRL